MVLVSPITKMAGGTRRTIMLQLVSALIVAFTFWNLCLGSKLLILSTNQVSLFSNPANVVPASFNASNPTLIIQLRGEMGNHLSAIAHGFGVKWYAAETFNMELQPLLRHQVHSPNSRKNKNKIKNQQHYSDSPKWRPTSQIVKQCFPKLKEWNFNRGASWSEYYERDEQQNEWLPSLTRNRLSNINGRKWLYPSNRDRLPLQARDLNESLTLFQKLLEKPNPPPPPPPSGIISLPFLYSDSLENAYLVDKYLDRMRDLFQFDFDKCCGNHPRPLDDETVLHFRNFATELTNSTSGLEDITPKQTADVLLGHLQPGDKVVITSRFQNERLQDLVMALQAKGLVVRVLEGQTGEQDFCFLLQSKKELVGNFQSTFVFWGALLGNARIVRLYTLDNPRLRQRCGPEDVVRRRFLFNWTHPNLANRVQLQLIQVDNETSFR